MEHQALLSSSTNSETKTRKYTNGKCILYSALIILFVFTLSIFLLHKYYSFGLNAISTNNIRNGDDAVATDYPWIASWRSKYGSHCCTASLINQNPAIVLTAAHCTPCSNSGGIDLGRTLTERTSDIFDHFDIDYVITHSSYDVALVILDGTTRRDTIDLVNPKLNSRDIFPSNTPIDILGYGALNQRDTIGSTQLQIANINYWTKKECKQQLREQCGCGSLWDEDSMLCGWHINESTEGGDSGGPALMNGLLSGINSWSPSKCDDNRVVDVFVDIGSVRHWIENNKPTIETYIVAIHICDEVDAGSINIDEFYVILHGTNGDSISLSLSLRYSDLDNILAMNEFNVFKYNIDNIGWTVDSITFLTNRGQSDSLCIDFVIVGRLDAPQLFAGISTQIWIQKKQQQLVLYDYCRGDANSISTMDLIESEKKRGGKKPESSNGINEYYYTLIIHVCDETFADSTDSFYVRLHGAYDSTEWFELENNVKRFDLDGIYIYYIDTKTYIGSDIQYIDVQSVGDDAICIDMISAGRAYNPYFWKGNNQQFWFQNPCSNQVPIERCYQYYSIPLICYH